VPRRPVGLGTPLARTQVRRRLGLVEAAGTPGGTVASDPLVAVSGVRHFEVHDTPPRRSALKAFTASSQWDPAVPEVLAFVAEVP
jgi:hypothetical protein